MDVGTGVIFALVALIGANQLLVRLRRVREDRRLFWTINVVNLVVGSLVLALGLPGYDHAPVVSWVVGLLLVMHVAQNLHIRSQWQQQLREDAAQRRDLERKQRRQAREEAEEEERANS